MYGQLLSRDFNPLDIPPITANGLAYQSAVRQWLPEANIVFDRFHVMQLYSKVIKQVRRTEFSKADAEHKEKIKGIPP